MDVMRQIRRRAFVREIGPILLLPIGAVLAYVGVVAGTSCQGYYPFTRTCAEQAYLVPGYATAFVGVCLALYGLGSFLARGGREAPVREPALRIADPALAARVEKGSRLTFVALIGAALVAAEAFPTYSLAIDTMQTPQPTFSLAWFLADLVVFGLADAMVLFAVYEWTESV